MMVSEKNKITRVAILFYEEIAEIKEERTKNGLGKISDRKATELIVRWKHWPQLKKDLLTYIEE